MQRDSAVVRLRVGEEAFDLRIIAAGASGLGTTVDAAARAVAELRIA